VTAHFREPTWAESALALARLPSLDQRVRGLLPLPADVQPAELAEVASHFGLTPESAPPNASPEAATRIKLSFLEDAERAGRPLRELLHALAGAAARARQGDQVVVPADFGQAVTFFPSQAMPGLHFSAGPKAALRSGHPLLTALQPGEWFLDAAGRRFAVLGRSLAWDGVAVHADFFKTAEVVALTRTWRHNQQVALQRQQREHAIETARRR
jgi:hypothetical protein